MGIWANYLPMARSLRLEFAGALYRINDRGDRREAIYENGRDGEIFLSVFGCEAVDSL